MMIVRRPAAVVAALVSVRQRLDPPTGLLPHRVDPGLVQDGPAVVSAPPDPPPATVRRWWRAPLLSLLVLVGVLPWLPWVLRRRRPGVSRRPRHDPSQRYAWES
ncbi:hypothetical protein AB0F73_03515 [Micromonospora purpureochromogenes]|uniref:hypothetical protein n=1 Tax=Micromonospora purpureochromogenes TaxID=47872 RepID=UPI0033C41027